ncbi:MAG: MobC family plasmid mobilization relaxosome protein [Lachnospiraceae bacterium]|nr:MobC family plasmid mobilization relaxosome protein [Lachnospiraceae bacterium]
MQKIGVNVNQIARRVNSTEINYIYDLYRIKGALEKICQLQRYTLSKLR